MALSEATYDRVVAALRDVLTPVVVPDAESLASVVARFPEVPAATIEGICARLCQSVARRRIWRVESTRKWPPAALLAEFRRRHEKSLSHDVLVRLAAEIGGVPPCHVARLVLRALAAEQAAEVARRAAIVRPDVDDETDEHASGFQADLGARGVALGRQSNHVAAERGAKEPALNNLRNSDISTAVRCNGTEGNIDATGNDTTVEQSENGALDGDFSPETAIRLVVQDPCNSHSTKTHPECDAVSNGVKNQCASQKDQEKKIFSFAQMYRKPALVGDAGLAANVAHCQAVDPLFSPAMDEARSAVGREWEDVLLAELRRHDIPHMDEARMRKLGYARTPDAVLLEPIAVRVRLCSPSGSRPEALAALVGDTAPAFSGDASEATVVVKWIESKAWFGDPPSHATYLRDQYWPYYNRFGPGLVIYWFGYVAEASGIGLHESRGIAVSAAFPPASRITRLSSPLYADAVRALGLSSEVPSEEQAEAMGAVCESLSRTSLSDDVPFGRRKPQRTDDSS